MEVVQESYGEERKPSLPKPLTNSCLPDNTMLHTAICSKTQENLGDSYPFHMYKYEPFPMVEGIA